MHHAAPLPSWVPEQVAIYQGDLLLTHPAFPFNPHAAADTLRTADREALAIDLGGDKLRSATIAVRDGRLEIRGQEVLQAKGGDGYLPALERLAARARAEGMPVGISAATRLEGSIITRTVNLPVFFAEIAASYDADFRKLFPASTFVANDTISGICGASSLLALRGEPVGEVIFVICASGLGASVLHQSTAIHVEIAHVPLVDQLNPLGQATPCHVPGKEYVCVERVTAARAGIEDIYRQRTGDALDGVALGARYEADDPLAVTLYETSALALAHAVAGVMTRYGFGSGAVAVFHGGNFELPRYRAAVQRTLARIPGERPRAVFSRDLSANTCLDGAAIGALATAP